MGLDHYRMTKYRGWYHHMTLCLLALACLKSVQFESGKEGATASVPEVRQLLEVVLPRRRWNPGDAIVWHQAKQRRKVVVPRHRQPPGELAPRASFMPIIDVGVLRR